MWSNCMRFVGEEGVRVGELETLAPTATNLPGMERWGYIVVEPEASDIRPKPPRSRWLIRATAKGRQAQEIWRSLFGVIERRWRTRFGADEIDSLRDSLSSLVGQCSADLPDCLPILGYGLFSRRPNRERRTPTQPAAQNSIQPATQPEAASGHRLPLSALLSRALLEFAIEFERQSDISLAISANILRVLNEDEKGVRVRDLPLLTGVSKEAIRMALGFLEKKRMAIVGSDRAASRPKVILLTPQGRKAQLHRGGFPDGS
jgi:DNA-binding MarR family transcriptional regulator